MFFDFQGEAALILEEYMPKAGDGSRIEGSFSLFTDSAGTVIASTDPTLASGDMSRVIPRASRDLGAGERSVRYMVFAGVESAIFSARTDGYLDYGDSAGAPMSSSRSPSSSSWRRRRTTSASPRTS